MCSSSFIFQLISFFHSIGFVFSLIDSLKCSSVFIVSYSNTLLCIIPAQGCNSSKEYKAGRDYCAVLWFRQHCTSYRKLLGVPEVTFFHWEWMSRQFLVFAELLELSSRTVPGFHSLINGAVEKGLTEWDFSQHIITSCACGILWCVLCGSREFSGQQHSHRWEIFLPPPALHQACQTSKIALDELVTDIYAVFTMCHSSQLRL
ncbi:hypothetical protein Droror1_Dr00023596 [Drosera rotundifolia]